MKPYPRYNQAISGADAASLGSAISLLGKLLTILGDVATHVNRSRPIFPMQREARDLNIGRQFGEHGRFTMRNTPISPSVGVAAGIFWRGPNPRDKHVPLLDAPPTNATAHVGIEVTHESRRQADVRRNLGTKIAGAQSWTVVDRGKDDWAVLVAYRPLGEFNDHADVTQWLIDKFDELLARKVL